MDDKDFVTHDEFSRELKKIYSLSEEQNKRLTNHDIQITQITTLYENLKDLPSALNSVKETMVAMQGNIERMTEKVQEAIKAVNEKTEYDKDQDSRLKALENKSKIDFVDFIRDNWWKICLGVASVMMLLKDYVK